MFATPEQLAKGNKANVESFLTLANTAFASAERFAALNLNTARSFLEDGMVNVKTLLGAKDIQDLMGLQTTLATRAAYMKSLPRPRKKFPRSSSRSSRK